LPAAAESARGVSPRAAHRTVRKPLGLHGSCHPVKAAASHHNRRFLLLPVDQSRSRRRWPAPFAPRALPRFTATTGQSVPARRISTFGLAGLPLVPFPLSPPDRFSSSIPEPRLESRHLYPGHRMTSNQVPAMLFPESGGAPVLMPSVGLFRGLISGSLAFVSLIPT